MKCWFKVGLSVCIVTDCRCYNRFLLPFQCVRPSQRLFHCLFHEGNLLCSMLVEDNRTSCSEWWDVMPLSFSHVDNCVLRRNFDIDLCLFPLSNQCETVVVRILICAEILTWIYICSHSIISVTLVMCIVYLNNSMACIYHNHK